MVGDEAYAGTTTAQLNYLLRDVDRVLATVNEVVGHGGLREPEPREPGDGPDRRDGATNGSQRQVG